MWWNKRIAKLENELECATKIKRLRIYPGGIYPNYEEYEIKDVLLEILDYLGLEITEERAKPSRVVVSKREKEDEGE